MKTVRVQQSDFYYLNTQYGFGFLSYNLVSLYMIYVIAIHMKVLISIYIFLFKHLKYIDAPDTLRRGGGKGFNISQTLYTINLIAAETWSVKVQI